MEDYLQTTYRQAVEILAERFGRQLTPRESPLLELVTCLLEDGAGGCLAPPDSSLSTDEWLRWNHLVSSRPLPLLATTIEVLQEEQFPLPEELTKLWHWATWLLLSTLDRLPRE